MAKAPRFIITVSGNDERLETAWTYSEAWCRSLALFQPGLRVTCFDTEAHRRVLEEELAAERAKEEGVVNE